MTQKQQILAALQAGERLTVLTALERFGCYALSQRRTGLRREGHPIQSQNVRLPNGKYIAEYYLDTAR